MSLKRITLIDALRGFALIGIVLIHSIEHFDFFRPPDFNFIFSPEFDQKVMEIAFLLISGKAYSIFAFMFGLSFFIQMDRQREKGYNFRARFMWRLTILFIFGFVHSLYYEGDILNIYAILGFTLVLLDRFNNRILIVLAILLLIQIPLLYHLFNSSIDPNYVYKETFGQENWAIASQTFATGDLIDLIKYNIWKGRSAVWGWMIYNGRYLQLIALFILGLIAGRNRIFVNINENKKLFVSFFIGSILFILILYITNNIIEISDLNKTQIYLSNKIIRSYTDLTFTIFIISLFTLVYRKFTNLKIFDNMAAFGRMSLTNYILQSLVGIFLFYNFGLGLYRYLGSAWSLLYGILFVLFQIILSKYWLQHYYYGPLEWLWRALTFMNFRLKFKKDN